MTFMLLLSINDINGSKGGTTSFRLAGSSYQLSSNQVPDVGDLTFDWLIDLLVTSSNA